eukprot:TRINITY_DN29647_c0_g1_i1.p1 TRINITY_DN29647_c0_g1~~TRINITY_DN29647_c0_g1_i1.p1  ORF type:complete len:592 (+),score=120.23 TRINITY_DN29647_c0_g1_i1:38-1813(+)
MAALPAIEQPSCKKSLGVNALREGLPELHEVMDGLMQRHAAEMHRTIEKWMSGTKQEVVSYSPWSSYGDSPNGNNHDHAHDPTIHPQLQPIFFRQNGFEVKDVDELVGNPHSPTLPGSVDHIPEPDAPEPKLQLGFAEHKGKPIRVSEEVEPEDPERPERKRRKQPRIPAQIFLDVDTIKNQLRENMAKHVYNTEDCYWETGHCRNIATNIWFENVTLIVITINAGWMGYDADSNHAPSLVQAEIQFIVVENLFCIFFFAELLVRFGAFKDKLKCLSDFWFMFDSGLVLLMVMETWILPIALAGASTKIFQNLRWLRLIRLTRLARIVRILRAVPELVIMIKAILVSLKTVSYIFALLIVVGYFFGVAFVILTEGSDERFSCVLTSMNTLLLAGALPDQADLVNAVYDSHSSPSNIVYYVLMTVYLMISALMMMNMLVGMLVEVISGVSMLEREEMMLVRVKSNLQEMLTELELIENEDDEITKDAFQSLLVAPKATTILQEVGVDVVGLVDFADYIFTDEKPALSFEHFMDVVLQLRGSNAASVKDIIDLRKLILSSERKLLSTKEEDIPISRSAVKRRPAKQSTLQLLR